MEPEVYNQLLVVSLTNPAEDLDRWMREDRHGPSFDTGCTVIVTKAEDLDEKLERNFKNLMWIVPDRLPKGLTLKVENPVVELYSTAISVRCPFAKAPKVSLYSK